MKQITGLLIVMAHGFLLAQQAVLPASGNMRTAVSVNVSTAFGKSARSVYVGNIELVGDGLRLQIINDGDSPVIAVDLAYELSGCNVDAKHWSVGGSADTAREPGMFSVDVPAHGRAWLRDSHMALALAFVALHQKTRYVQASAQVLAFKLLDGRVITFAALDGRERTRPLVSPKLCGNWVWDEQLSQVHGYRGTDQHESKSLTAKRISYTCAVLDGVLTCPE